jgi:hypothetical protein
MGHGGGGGGGGMRMPLLTEWNGRQPRDMRAAERNPPPLAIFARLLLPIVSRCGTPNLRLPN